MVSLQKFGRVYLLTLIGEGEHRFNGESCDAIIEALETVNNAEDAGALVTTNEGKFFSNGLDINWAKTARSSSPQTDNKFGALLRKVLTMNVPTIAAICGHAAAGAFIFALAHDHRCMRSDRGYLYMSELDVQVRVTTGTMALVRAALSPKAFKDTMLLAKKQTAKEAYDNGIVDSVHENSAKTLEAAMALAKVLSERGWDRNFYKTMRLDMKPDLLDALGPNTPFYKEHNSKL